MILTEFLYRTGFRLTNPVEARVAHWLRGMRHAGVPRGDLKGHLVAAINLYLDWLDGRIQIANAESHPFPISRPDSGSIRPGPAVPNHDAPAASAKASLDLSPKGRPDVSPQDAPVLSSRGQSGDVSPPAADPGSRPASGAGKSGSDGTDSSFGTLAKYVDDF